MIIASISGFLGVVLARFVPAFLANVPRAHKGLPMLGDFSNSNRFIVIKLFGFCMLFLWPLSLLGRLRLLVLAFYLLLSNLQNVEVPPCGFG